jgi:DNA-binding MarR family transcriptional regulator
MDTPLSPDERLAGLFARLEALSLRNVPIKRLDLSVHQFGFLLHIFRKPGIRARELAGALGVTMPTVSVALRKLEQSGWIYRKGDPDDKRASRLFLARKAQVLANRAQDFRRKRVDEFMEALTPAEQEQLFLLLEKAIGNLEQKKQNQKLQVIS